MVAVERGRPVWALGLMSGTSMDAVDAALLLSDGEEIAAFGPARALPWEAADRALLREAVAAAAALPDAALGDAAHWPRVLHRAARRVVEAHAEAVRRLGGSPAVIGFHGQTVAHRPAAGITLQLGDGGALARATGVPVVWDFRSADMAAGGEGAPLAPFYHFALARRLRAEGRIERGPLAFLNIGGVANVTWVDPAAPAPEAPGALVAFDTGPGNALIDDFAAARTGRPRDEGGGLAARGRVHDDILAPFRGLDFFSRKPPKSLDRNDFASLADVVAGLSDEDGAATLTAFSAECVALARAHLPAPPRLWLVTGGGRHNATLMAMLAARLDAPVRPVEAVGLDGDMLEAQAFAHLALRVLRGLPTSAPGTTGCRAPVSGGRLAEP